jgi:hypothetical protein
MGWVETAAWRFGVTDVSEDKELTVVHHTAVTEGEKRCQMMGG